MSSSDREAVVSTLVAKTTPVRLALFLHWAARASWEAYGLDGDEIQDKAISLGLFKVEPYDPDRHGSADGMIDPGEDWYMMADDVQALLTDGLAQEKSSDVPLSDPLHNQPKEGEAG